MIRQTWDSREPFEGAEWWHTSFSVDRVSITYITPGRKYRYTTLDIYFDDEFEWRRMLPSILEMTGASPYHKDLCKRIRDHHDKMKDGGNYRTRGRLEYE